MTSFDIHTGMTYNKATRTLIAEASDIGFTGHNGFVYLYDSKIGWRCRFNHVHTERDLDRDIVKWEFENVNDPDVLARRLVIFND